MPTVIKCIVQDKKTIEVLRLLKPYALDPPVVDPMDESPRQKHSGVPIKQMLVNHVTDLGKKGVKLITSKDFTKYLKDAGYDPNSYSYALSIMLKKGLLKKTKTPSTYEIIK